MPNTPCHEYSIQLLSDLTNLPTLEDPPVDCEEGDVEGPPTEVEDQDVLLRVVGLVQHEAAAKRSGTRSGMYGTRSGMYGTSA